MTSALTYIVDDQDPSIEYLCPVVKEVHLRSYFNDTWTTIASPDCGGGWFRYKFNGTSVRIAASASRITQNFTVQIDGSPLLIQSGNGLYQSPNLLDGEHTVLYAVSDPSIYPSFDYLSVTSTSVVGRNIIMDDTDGAIKYSGNWSPNPATGPVSFDYSTMPYLNTTHWSNTVGDSFSFQFSGDSVAIYGVLLSQSNETVSGNLTATYSVDGKTSALALPTGASWNNPMSRLFSVDLPDSGSHTVVVNVTSGHRKAGPWVRLYDLQHLDDSFFHLQQLID
ncbi:hypothetical protein C8J56DRAFT_266322 [Mycena floridula]|nr:hypothetical protein C8J56DRAFT_266322 [Mycena floridula]